jgi:hypothetical protein
MYESEKIKWNISICRPMCLNSKSYIRGDAAVYDVLNKMFTASVKATDN